MILNEDALVVDYGALLDQQADALTALDGLIGDAESAGEDGTLERMEALKIVFQDEGRFAAAAGYDAIAIPYEDQTSGGAHPGQTQVVILNRTAVIVDDSMFAWNYERKAWTWNKRPS